MDIRGPFSRLKKKLRHPGSKPKPGRTGLDSGGEREDLAASPSVLLADGGHNRGEDGANADGRQISSTDRPLSPDVPGPALAGRSEGNQGGGDGGIDGVEVSQRHSHPHSDVKVVVGSGPSCEGTGSYRGNAKGVIPSPSTPSIQLSGKSSM